MNAARTRSDRRRIGQFVISGVVAATVLAAVVTALIVPPDAVQGPAQKVMYLHVPFAWTAYLSFAIVLVGSVVYLRTYRRRAADVARGAAEAGLVLTGLTLASGMVWGSLTWGTAWVWDGRTTSTVAMGLVYVIYVSARALETGRRSRLLAAWIGTVGFVTVPVVHLSVLWWRTLHQPATVLAPSTAPPLHPAMGAALALSALAATLLTLAVIRWRAGVHGRVPVEADAGRRARVASSTNTGGRVRR